MILISIAPKKCSLQHLQRLTTKYFKLVSQYAEQEATMHAGHTHTHLKKLLTTERKVSLVHIEKNLLTSLWFWALVAGVSVCNNCPQLGEKFSLFFFPSPFCTQRLAGDSRPVPCVTGCGGDTLDTIQLQTDLTAAESYGCRQRLRSDKFASWQHLVFFLGEEKATPSSRPRS